MRLIYRLVFIFIMALLVLSCDTERDKAQFSRLAQLDSLLDTSPEKTKDSLQKINPKDLSRYNYGYYLLLDVIAKDKTYYNFISDSLIQTSLERLDNSKNEYPDNYARALIYSGIVRNIFLFKLLLLW